MRTLDSLMYGLDETEFASDIASSALKDPNEDRHSGDPIDQAARAKGNQPSKGNIDAVVTKLGLMNDKRACPTGNHGKQGCND